MHQTVYIHYMDSPLGAIEIKGTDEHITSVLFVESTGNSHVPAPAILQQCRVQLHEYFTGKRQVFELPIAPQGTPFQQQVWQQLQHIPYGESTSYVTIARQLGMEDGASRAVGHANGQNPIAIIVPCHRVIGSNGKLTGYAGGLWRKQWLLSLEGKTAGTRFSLFE